MAGFVNTTYGPDRTAVVGAVILYMLHRTLTSMHVALLSFDCLMNCTLYHLRLWLLTSS
jgi:hypothetical protein